MNLTNNIVLLETLRRDRDNSRNFLFTDPVEIITCHKPAELQKCFQQMENCRGKGFYLAGFFAYEMGYFLEESLRRHCPKIDYPLLWFGVYPEPLRRLPRNDKRENRSFFFSEPRLAIDFRQYEKAIRKIKTCIARGETYQINYTSRYDFHFIGDIAGFYENLKQSQKVSYSALIHFDGNAVISLSPELFFRIDSRGNIMVKPMKGTSPLAATSSWLSHDAKNQSENVMIVDLLRNDLGRICLPGSVRVKKLFEVEKYETLLQMTSTVTGRLRPQIKILDMVKSLFPCGSVTGAPKIRSMKIISDLEHGPRNIYTGAIGYFAPDGQSVFNVAIRTIDLRRQSGHKYQARMGVGGGIVFDSRPKNEFEECRLKGQFLTGTMPEFALIETMLLTDGKIKYLRRHLRRLKKTARTFSIACPVDKIKTALNACAAKLSGRIRLRLLLKPDGNFLIQHHPVSPCPASSPFVVVSRHKTNSGDPFLYHKTTHRKLYDEEFKRHSAQGYFDVVFQNEKDEITEGAISNIFILVKGRWYTPPLSCGLLNGIARQVMIRKLNAGEKILYLKDLKSADRIVLTNSVRGANTVNLKSERMK
ncbi:MAG: aminodeoxychorismate synthase, component I [Deltaproteobacteria bacterium HGW-Deltaproteobacteria-1]|jgi:para-aminobenzoate synthetase/4-amino-4-deoxychorismate lyase|nr:MAG: aminodeoxychorismate synthase, component I [Deltaproteobacteria bacterium HGW-Deltaproteobacteria-1]